MTKIFYSISLKSILSPRKTKNLIKKIDLIKKFYEYKESIKFVGEIVRKELIFLDRDKFELFFQGYFKEIRYIIHYVLNNPQKFAR